MKHSSKYIILCGLIIMTALVFSCSDTEPHLGKTSTVIIDLGLPDDIASTDTSVMDRILRFLSPRPALAQKAPAAFRSVTVRINGEDIGQIERDFAPLESITLKVPSGAQRRFEVTAHVDPADPSAAMSFRGIATRNLPADETINIPVVMRVNETKIVIPDPGPVSQQNNRIIQINNMSGAGRIVKIGTDIGFGGIFRPWAIDFDARGRIYIANNNGTGSNDVVISIQNMNSTTCITFGDGLSSGINSIAIDRINNYVYYATEGPPNLKRCGLDGNNDTTLSTTGISSISGLDVGMDGMLYISGINSVAQNTVFRYDPTARLVTASYSGFASAADVEVKGFLYLCS